MSNLHIRGRRYGTKVACKRKKTTTDSADEFIDHGEQTKKKLLSTELRELSSTPSPATNVAIGRLTLLERCLKLGFVKIGLHSTLL